MEKIQKEHEQGGTYSSVDKNTTGTNSTSVGLEGLDIPKDNQSNVTNKTSAKPWLFQKGNSGGPGRPKGKTLKEWRRESLAAMTDEERKEFLKTISNETQWKMAEGNPPTVLMGDKENPIRIIKVDEDLADIYDITPESETSSQESKQV